MKYLPIITAAMSLSVVHGQQPAVEEEKVAESMPSGTRVVLLGADIRMEASQIMSEFKNKKKQVYSEIKKEKEKDKEKAKRLYLKLPHGSDYAKRLFTLVNQDVKAKGAEAALLWIAKYGNAGQRNTAVTTLLTEYADSPSLISLVRNFARSYRDNTARLKRLALAAGDRHVRVAAFFSIAQELMRKQANANLSSERREALKMEILSIFSAIKSLPSIEETDSRICQSIKSISYKMEHLSVGCVAPDIVAKDEAGVEFKLSDYRGKVVLLDFWGYW